ncbi:MAG: DoxX family membrane protein [Gemmatimonadaceae bacterium]
MYSETRAEENPYDGRRRLGLTWSRLLLAMLFVFAGIMHFVAPEPYAAIVPKWLPNAPLLVVISGIAEILGGLAVLLSHTRRLAGWGLIALLIAVFPANIHMLQLGHANHAPAYWMAALWIRLPLQLLMIWWVWRAAARPAR